LQRAHRLTVAAIAGAMAAIGIAAWLSGDKSGIVTDTGINATAVAAAGSSLFAARAQKSAPGRRLFAALTIALFFWLAAELTWSYMLFVTGEDPYPSAADLLYLAGYGFAAYLVFSLYRTLASKARETKMALLVGSITVEAMFLNLFLIQIVESAIGFEGVSQDDLATFAVSALYPLLDGVLLVPAAVIVAGYRSALIDKFSIVMLVLALRVLAIADTGFGCSALHDEEAGGIVWDMMYCLSYLCFAGALANTYFRQRQAKAAPAKQAAADYV
jgi:hypothetical protein